MVAVGLELVVLRSCWQGCGPLPWLSPQTVKTALSAGCGGVAGGARGQREGLSLPPCVAGGAAQKRLPEGPLARMARGLRALGPLRAVASPQASAAATRRGCGRRRCGATPSCRTCQCLTWPCCRVWIWWAVPWSCGQPCSLGCRGERGCFAARPPRGPPPSRAHVEVGPQAGLKRLPRALGRVEVRQQPAAPVART